MRGREDEAVNSRCKDLELGVFELYLKESEQGLEVILFLFFLLSLFPSAILIAAEFLGSLSSLFFSNVFLLFLSPLALLFK